MDVVRGLRFYQDPESPLALCPSVTIQHKETNSSKTTEVVKDSTNPFFNEHFEVVIGGEDPLPAGTKTVFRFILHDNSGSAPKDVGVGEINVDVSAATKTETTAQLELTAATPVIVTEGPTNPDAPAPAETQSRGTLAVRWKVTLPKPKVVDHNADIVLATIPKLSGDVSIVPDVRPFVWWHITHDASWRESFSSAVLSAFATTDRKDKHPATNVAEVLMVKWKCRRSHQLITKLRIVAERYHNGERLPFSADEELGIKQRWKELALIRTDVFEKSQKMKEAMDRLWLFFVCEVPIDVAYTPQFEHRAKLNSTVFGRKQAEMLQSSLLQQFITSITTAVADGVAKEDFDVEIKAQQQASEAATASGSSAATAAPSPSSGGTPASRLFQDVIKKYICAWCDTITEAEFQSLAASLLPAITATRNRIAAAAQEAESPGKGKGKGARKTASARSKTGKERSL